ncbi:MULTISPECIES: Ldh family oxidoreductase [unclassified Cupriavidus]|uniref:Ldh family oxidoreductase n=1 Tax=unclassified Cupriavidus TaxID=2640874 RepID=UPI00295E6428|nr:Ldh family oxidoreductase [Cupriavidus sp. TA19]
MPTSVPASSHCDADAHALSATVSAIFERLGVAQADAVRVADTLVEADMEGVPSHGVMLVPMYAQRLRDGSVTTASRATVVSDNGGCVVLDAANMLGQLSAFHAVALARERAGTHGIGAVAVRNAFHFGAAGLYARALASDDCIGIVMSNTRPLMPAPGGAQRVVGNNPLAIALPGADDIPVELDMAMSASAMGKIRLAAAAGREIPAGWATDAHGRPTTDAAAALAGMLLPAAGPKGFGLAFMVDMLCGGLSGGGTGEAVQPLYGDSARPYNCAHFFLAIDVAHFGDAGAFARTVSQAAAGVRNSHRAPGTERIYSPGEIGWAKRHEHGSTCHVDRAVLTEIVGVARALPAAIPPSIANLTDHTDHTDHTDK